MLTAAQLVPFLLAVALIELTPGPSMGYLAVVASRSGRTAGMMTVAGVTVGLSTYLGASVLGLAELALRWPWTYEALRWAGVVYLGWLAIDTWRGSAGVTALPEGRRLFLRGLLNNLLNPKAAAFYIALLPSFVRPDQGNSVGQALTLGAVHIRHPSVRLKADLPNVRDGWVPDLPPGASWSRSLTDSGVLIGWCCAAGWRQWDGLKVGKSSARELDLLGTCRRTGSTKGARPCGRSHAPSP